MSNRQLEILCMRAAEGDAWVQTELRKLAGSGTADIHTALGLIYQYQDDDTEAVKWFRMAAEQGDAIAQRELGNAYCYGHGVEHDYMEAVKWYRMAAEHGGGGVLFDLGIACCNLGNVYCNGDGVEQDYTEAVKWYLMAAEHGNAEAQLYLGNAYCNGNGVEQDYAEAVKWYCMSVEREHPCVQYDWGERFEFGKDIPQDLDAAEHLFSLAAIEGNREARKVIDIVFERKDIEAMFECGNAYLFGDGSQNIFWPDYARAEIWYRRAAIHGHKGAAAQLRKLFKTE